MQVASYMPQGKAVDLRGRQFVVRLKEVFDQERRAGAVVSTKDPAGRVAKALGLGKRTVKDILRPLITLGNSLRPVSKRKASPPTASRRPWKKSFANGFVNAIDRGVTSVSGHSCMGSASMMRA